MMNKNRKKSKSNARNVRDNFQLLFRGVQETPENSTGYCCCP